MAATASRSAHLGLLLVVVASLCITAASFGNGGSEAGAMVASTTSRHLLQTVRQCPVDFGVQNYTVVTSVCNATNPDTAVCCAAFVEFACPFATYINDLNTNCRDVMFTYLTLAGNYPPALFTTCQGDNVGLPCPLVPEPSPNPSSASMAIPLPLSSLFILVLTLLCSCAWDYHKV